MIYTVDLESINFLKRFPYEIKVFKNSVYRMLTIVNPGGGELLRFIPI